MIGWVTPLVFFEQHFIVEHNGICPAQCALFKVNIKPAGDFLVQSSGFSRPLAPRPRIPKIHYIAKSHYGTKHIQGQIRRMGRGTGKNHRNIFLSYNPPGMPCHTPHPPVFAVRILHHTGNKINHPKQNGTVLGSGGRGFSFPVIGII